MATATGRGGGVGGRHVGRSPAQSFLRARRRPARILLVVYRVKPRRHLPRRVRLNTQSDRRLYYYTNGRPTEVSSFHHAIDRSFLVFGTSITRGLQSDPTILPASRRFSRMTSQETYVATLSS